MTPSSWLIVADDLTGAADCAVAFAARGLPTTVGWGSRRPSFTPVPSVFAFNADSRGLSAAEAAARRRALMRALPAELAGLFIKIDSTLRGQPAAEIRAALEARRQLVIVAPAFPATGRTTEGGRVKVSGQPLEETELWRRDHSYADADLVAVLASEGLTAARIVDPAGLAAAAASGVDAVVCDAKTDADLDRIVSAGLSLYRPAIWVGAGGLTAALARAARGAPPASLTVPASASGLLVVAGSPAAATRAAAARLARDGGVLEVAVEASNLLSSGLTFDPAVADALAAGRDVMVNLKPEDPVDLTKGHRLVRALGQALRPLSGRFGAMVVTGGETAAAVLNALGIDGVRLAEEMEPGVSVGLTLGELSFPIVTKAGAFGDDAVLLRAVERLRQIKLEGQVA